jgi:hypothetical protein
MKYARFNENGIAIETFILPEGVSISECFTAEIAAQFESVPDDLQANDSRPVVDTPVVEEAVVETPVETPAETPPA